jgi:hypothetical protein
MKEITEHDVLEAFKNYKMEYPENNYTDPHYEKDWRKLTCSYHVVYENDVPYPLKRIYQYAAKYKLTGNFTTDEADKKVGKYFRIGTAVPAEYFKETLREERAKLVAPIGTDVEKANSDIIVGILKILNNQNKLLLKINSNTEELINLVEKLGK